MSHTSPKPSPLQIPRTPTAQRLTKTTSGIFRILLSGTLQYAYFYMHSSILLQKTSSSYLTLTISCPCHLVDASCPNANYLGPLTFGWSYCPASYGSLGKMRLSRWKMSASPTKKISIVLPMLTFWVLSNIPRLVPMSNSSVPSLMFNSYLHTNSPTPLLHFSQKSYPFSCYWRGEGGFFFQEPYYMYCTVCSLPTIIRCTALREYVHHTKMLKNNSLTQTIPSRLH